MSALSPAVYQLLHQFQVTTLTPESLILLGQHCPLTPLSQFCSADKLHGCQSTVYLHYKDCEWRGWADALLAKGMLALALAHYRSISLVTVAQQEVNFAKSLGLETTLSIQRQTGWHALASHARRHAILYISQHPTQFFPHE